MNDNNYKILPFQFSRFDTESYLLVNESGEYIFLDENIFHLFVKHNLELGSPAYYDLKSKHFLNTDHLSEALELISTKYRSRKRFVSDFTSLHMMVVTLRCSNKCSYCQVSAEEDISKGYDMTPEVAHRIVDYIFKTPSPSIKIEFQGGEPTLNWNTIVETVRYAKRVNRLFNKHLEFVVCTNLVKVTVDQLNFLREHGIGISTSLDGPREIHDKNRLLRGGGGTYDAVINNLESAFDILGRGHVNALMTTTKDNINCLDEVITEYIRLGFSGIFIRSLNPYGSAAISQEQMDYPIEHFAKKYEEALNFIIEINLSGKHFVEFFSNLLLSRILTPFSTGFVDLQSPSGAGISGVIYDHNGDVFPSDEARMLARMGDRHFCLGNVFNNSYEDIFAGKMLREIVSKSCVEIMPYCSSCVYRSYCGSDPVRNYLETCDIIGHRPDNGFCKKNKLIFDMLFKKLKKNNPDEMDVFWSWISCRSVEEIRGETE